MEAASAESVVDGVVRCACCKRFPLVGERVIRHLARQGPVWACESCETDGRATRLGTVAESDRVRTLGGLRNVRRLTGWERSAPRHRPPRGQKAASADSSSI